VTVEGVAEAQQARRLRELQGELGKARQLEAQLRASLQRRDGELLRVQEALERATPNFARQQLEERLVETEGENRKLSRQLDVLNEERARLVEQLRRAKEIHGVVAHKAKVAAAQGRTHDAGLPDMAEEAGVAAKHGDIEGVRVFVRAVEAQREAADIRMQQAEQALQHEQQNHQQVHPTPTLPKLLD
jgi:predicted nuclease with TOPRIM domain